MNYTTIPLIASRDEFVKCSNNHPKVAGSIPAQPDLVVPASKQNFCIVLVIKNKKQKSCECSTHGGKIDNPFDISGLFQYTEACDSVRFIHNFCCQLYKV